MADEVKIRKMVPMNTRTRVHPDRTKYDKSHRQRWKQDLRRGSRLAGRIEFYPHRTQSFDYDCGATAVLTVLNYYGFDNERKVNEQTVFELIGTDVNGTDNEGIEAGLKKIGLTFENVHSLEDINRHVDENRPVIVCAVTYPHEWHYMVVIGKEEDHYIVSDPWSLPISWVKVETFDKVWREEDGTRWGVAVMGNPKYRGGIEEMDVRVARRIQMKQMAQIADRVTASMIRKAGTWALPDNANAVRMLENVVKALKQGKSPQGRNDVTDILYPLLGDDELFDSLERLAKDYHQKCGEAVVRRIRQMASESSQGFDSQEAYENLVSLSRRL